MNIRKASRLSLGCVVVAIAAFVFSPNSTDPRVEVCRILSALGYERSPADLREQVRPGSGSFVVSLPGVGEALCVTGGATGRIVISTGRYVQNARGLGRTGARKWASQSAAQAYADAKATAILRTNSWLRRKVTLSQDSPGSGGVGDVHRAGRLTARYVNLYSGYPFVDRFVGCTLMLDSQDGALVEYHGGCSPVPSREPLPSSHLTEQQAQDRIRTISPRATFGPNDHELGWAVPPGKTKAVLVHRFWGTRFLVSSPNGEYWDRI